jgi:hypothetical protein
MKTTLRYFFFSAVVFLLSCAVSSAQDITALMETISQTDADCVVVEYTFSANVGEDSVKDKGVAEAQDGMWCLKGMTLEIYTDGKATWVLYPEVKEAIVEPMWTLDDLKVFYESAQSSGNDVDIQVVSVTKTEKRQVSYFTPSLGDDWVVTDLR